MRILMLQLTLISEIVRVVGDCSETGCLNNGVCQADPNYHCECPSGFTGQDCGLVQDHCQSDPCLNGGKCQPEIDGYGCQCAPNWRGVRCETAGSPCGFCTGKSLCQQINSSSYGCVCDSGFKPPHCTEKIDYCNETQVCLNNGTCINAGSDKFPTCLCSPGFRGKRCAFPTSGPTPSSSDVIACHSMTHVSNSIDHCYGSWCNVIAGTSFSHIQWQPFLMGCTSSKPLTSIPQGCYLINSYSYCQCDFGSYCSDHYQISPSVYANDVECCLDEECTLTINATFCIIARNSNNRIIFSYSQGLHGLFDWSRAEFNGPAILRQLADLVVMKKYCMHIASGAFDSIGSTFICYCYGAKCNRNITEQRIWAEKEFAKYPNITCSVLSENGNSFGQGHFCMLFYETGTRETAFLSDSTNHTGVSGEYNFQNPTLRPSRIKVQTSIRMTNPAVIYDSTYECMNISLIGKIWIYCICDSNYCNTIDPRTSSTTPQPRPSAPPHYKPPPGKDRDMSQSLQTGFSVGAVLLFIFCLVVAFYWRKRYRKLRTDRIIEMASVRSNESDQNSYTKVGEIFAIDKWEIPRERIIIHENRELGVGSFGKVYEGTLIRELSKPGEIISTAEDAQSTVKVAVKVVSGASDYVSLREFNAEIELMKKIGDHAHVARILGCVTKSQPIQLIMEFCSDGNLLNFLKRHRRVGSEESPPLTILQLISFAWQISDGMEYISSKGFIHRDLAARNVLIHRKQIAKVSDFGLCRYPNSPDDSYVTRGGKLPLRWMPLEAIRDHLFSVKSDVFAFGVLLFELTSFGSVPYATVQAFEMEKHLEDGNRLPQTKICPDSLYELMLNCWSLEPEHRPSFSELKKALAFMVEELSESSSAEYVNLS